MRIEITIPVLNEQETIAKKVEEVDRFLSAEFPEESIHLVVADNGSTDQTEAIAKKLSATLDRVEYLRLSERGVGRALKASWTQSKADIVGYMDLDLATDLSYLRPALNALIRDEADVVTGSRLAKGSTVIGRKFVRKVTSVGLNLLVRLVFSTTFTDGMCGFKFLKRTEVEKLIESGARSDGWFFATELLIVGEHLGLRIKDLPVRWTDDPESKVRIVSLSLEYIRAMKSLKKILRQVPRSI